MKLQADRRDGIGLQGDGEKPSRANEDPRILQAWRQHLKRRTRSYTPFLVVPYAPVAPLVPGATTDQGRVRPVPGGQAYWASPYILVENSGGISYTGRAGENNFVHARVFNFGKATSAPTQVDFYWADPSLGLGPASFHHIGTEWVEIRHGASLDVRCNTAWVPTFLNNGHECLMVNTSNPTIVSGLGPTPGPFDPIQAPFSPVLDRHVGQRNIAVLPAPMGEPMEIMLHLTNVLPFAATMAVTARTACFDVDPDLVKQLGEVNVVAGLLGLMDNRKIPAEAPVRLLDADTWVKAEVGDLVDVLPTAKDRRFAARLVEHLPAGNGDLKDLAVVSRAELKAGERRQLKVSIGVPDQLKPGQFIVADIGQAWDGRMLGGYVVVGVLR